MKDILINRFRTYLRNAAEAEYNPVTGFGCTGRRCRIATPVPELPYAYVPAAMAEDPQLELVRNNPTEWKKLRFRHDFEYWSVCCATIKPKTGWQYQPFVLNGPQRRVVAALEADRLAGRPMRMIILKARQWGASTLVQMYMAWIQCCLRTHWNSLICSQVKQTSLTLRGMLATVLDNYPQEYWPEDKKPVLKPFQSSDDVRMINTRECCVSVASCHNQDSIRGADYAMAHLSEVAFWPRTRKRSPIDFLRAILGSVAIMPGSLVVMESTANGVGNFFHQEWLRCKSGEGDKHAVFVPWYEIELNRLKAPDDRALLASLDEYERNLWEQGLCLDQIYWYRCKTRAYGNDKAVHAEFPTTDTEAFTDTGRNVFAQQHVENMRAECTAPAHKGEVDASPAFADDPKGKLEMWEAPQPGAQYVAAVDVGGRSQDADYSVIAVMKRVRGGIPEVVAQWRGHADHDRVATNAVNIARYYSNALLAIESNTFETANYGGDTDSNLFILSRIAEVYPNLYRRRHYDAATQTWHQRVGFHTNRATKAILVDTLVEAVRDGLYTERSAAACDEMDTYEQRGNGSYGAKDGHHDDILMTRALALHVMDSLPAMAPDSYSQLPSW